MDPNQQNQNSYQQMSQGASVQSQPTTQAPDARTQQPAPSQQFNPQSIPQERPAVQNPQIKPSARAPVVPANVNKNSTQNNLDIAEIRDGLVIMNDGSYRSVIMAQSINFDLMNPQEREAVEYAYQSFLNSLYFTVQIFMRSQKVDMRPYLEKLEKAKNDQENMLLSLLMEDYIYFITDLVQQTNIMDKKFYIVVPYSPVIDPKQAFNKGKKAVNEVFSIFKFKKTTRIIDINQQDLEKAKTELKNRVQGVVNSLINVGIQAVPLSTEELIELYYSFYNPGTSSTEELKNYDELSTPIVTKGQGEAPRKNLQEGN